MRGDIFHANLKNLLFQRNIFLAISCISIVSQLATILLLFNKQERVIIAPPIIAKEFWVDSSSVSSTYLEQFGAFVAQLILSKSPANALSQRNTILRHADISYVGILEKKLIEEEKKLTNQNASYVFFPSEILTNPDKFEVSIYGERTFYVSGKVVSSSKEKYILKFAYKNGHLLLKEIIAGDGNAKS